MSKTKEKASQDIFPSFLSNDTKQKLASLAETAFGKPTDQLTRQDILLVVEMDFRTTINKLTISASATRPTDIKYATNNYFASMEIDISGYSKLVHEKLSALPEDQIVDKYLEMKQLVYNMIRLKYESSENYLRSLLDIAITRDGCPKVGRDID
jgi:hypothetical protein